MVGGGGLGWGLGSTATSCKPFQIHQRRLGNGVGVLQRHDSSQSRGGEDRLRVGLTGAVCFERNLMLQSSRKKNQMAVVCCNDRTDERRPVVRP